MNLFQRKTTWQLEKAELKETVEELPNPARGWYQIYPFHLERYRNPEELSCCLNDEEQLAFVLVDIGAYRNRELDAAPLQYLRNILDFFCRNGKEIILRAAYDTQGKGMEHEPSRFDRVQGHLQKICQVAKAFAPHIFVYQGILVGSWGEMHNSRYLSQERLRSLVGILEREMPENVFLAVRKPVYYRQLRPMEQWGKTPEKRLGLFNDGIFGSKTDLGTYSPWSFRDVGWEQPWLPFEELTFQDQLCRLVPQGGEALMAPSGVPPLPEAVEQLRKMHLTYLNCKHDPDLLNAWRSQRWQSADGWDGMDGYHYIGRHMGYRYCITGVSGGVQRKEEGFRLAVCLENVGFAACCHDLQLTLLQQTRDGALREYSSAFSNGLSSRERTEVYFHPHPEESSLYLRLTRTRDGRQIHFGTVSSGASDLGLYLGRIVAGE